MISTLILAATLTVTDYATMPAVSSPQWSPDGKQIAYVVTQADLQRNVYDSDVWLINADGTNDRRITFANGSDARPRWSPDGTRIAFLSDRSGRNAIHILDARGSEARQLSTEPTAIQTFEWSPDGREIAFTRIDEAQGEGEPRVVGENLRHVHLYLLDVATGKSRKLTEGNLTVFDYDFSPDGATLAVSTSDAPGLDGLHATDIHLVSRADGKMRPLVVRPGHDRNAKFSPDGKQIAFTSAGGAHHWLVEFAVHTIDVAGGTPRKVAYDRTPDTHDWTDDGKGLWIEGPWNLSTRLFRATHDQLETVVDGEVNDTDAHGNRIAYISQSFTSPPELHVDGKRLTNHNAAFRGRELGETRVVRWKNPKDGLEIEGLLTLPVGYPPSVEPAAPAGVRQPATPRRVPLLTFVHGGPASRFDSAYLGYLGHVYAPQALAAQGYAVLRPNPRGTGGYGFAFRTANKNDWAGLDWLDINAGIDKLIADGIADPDRLGLMGWSYGGFIAAWALGHSDRFQAISVGAPVVDLLSFHGTTDIRRFIPSYFPEMSLDALRERSPLWHLTKTKAKVLIQHGEADDRVPPSQGMMLWRRLDELGVDAKLVLYPRTPHVPREPKLRIDVARRNLEFFTNAIPPGLVPTTQ